MSFERTLQGQQNRSLFYDVDFIVYTEGGDIEREKFVSFDAAFWKAVFRALRPDLKCKFLPRGSKINLISYIEDIKRGVLLNNIVAIDRDYDEFYGNLYESNFVIYTYGYSYENDIYDEKIVVDTFLSLCPSLHEEDNISHEVNEFISNFVVDSRFFSYADFLAFSIGQKVIDRDKLGQYIDHKTDHLLPKLNSNEIRKAVRVAALSTGRRRVPRGTMKRIDIPRFSVGHFYELFVFKIIFYLHKKYSDTQKLTKDSIRSHSIQMFSIFLRDMDSEVVRYYNRVMGAI